MRTSRFAETAVPFEHYCSWMRAADLADDLYLIRNERCRVIYVGRSLDTTTRLATHRSSAPFASAIASVDVLPGRGHLESAYIGALMPEHNIANNPGWKVERWRYAPLMTDRMPMAWAPFLIARTLSGIGRQGLRRLIERGVIEAQVVDGRTLVNVESIIAWSLTTARRSESVERKAAAHRAWWKDRSLETALRIDPVPAGLLVVQP